MTIDGTNISSFGLTLLEVKDFLNLPKRKEITEVPFFTANDIKFKSATPTVVLYGRWATIAAMETALNSFKSHIKNSIKHTIVIEEYSIPEIEECIFKDGYEVEFMGSVARITAKITVANKKWIASE